MALRYRSIFVFSLGLLLAASTALGALTATQPPLGINLPQFGVLGGAGVTGSTGLGTSVNGDVGSSPTATILEFVGSTIPGPSRTVAPFIVHYINDAVVQQAHNDAIGAYNNLFTQGTNPAATAIGPELSNLILTPGVYRLPAAANLASPGGAVTGVLTLNDPTGTGIFVFSVGTALTVNVNASFAGTANPCNVYWQIGTDAVLNGNNFFGTLIADQSVTNSSASNVLGRIVGVNAAVTMPAAGGNTIGGCSAAVVLPPPPTGVGCPAGLLTSGGPGLATITLPAPAPPGGTVVTLTSSAPGTATVPVSVLIPAGATSITVFVTPGLIPGNATITATTAGGSVSCTLTVTAAAGPSGGAAGGPTLDAVGMMILLALLAIAGVFAVNRFTS